LLSDFFPLWNFFSFFLLSSFLFFLSLLPIASSFRLLQ